MPDVTQMIADTAARYGVAPVLAIEVATAESGLNPNTGDSPSGAIGLFQLMPATAAQLGVDPRDPAQNIDGGVRYLRQMLGQFGDIAAALGAYNWGPGAVSGAIGKYGADWLSHAPSETRNYVAKILGNLGTQYTVSVAPPPASADDTGAFRAGSSFRASVTADEPDIYASSMMPPEAESGIGKYLLWGVVGIFALWIFEEAI